MAELDRALHAAAESEAALGNNKTQLIQLRAQGGVYREQRPDQPASRPLTLLILFHRVGRSPSVGRPQKPFSTGSSPRPAMCGAMASSCGR